MYQYKYLKYKQKYLKLKKIKGGIHQPCIFLINKYLKKNINFNNITLDYFLSNYKNNIPYYYFYNDKLDLYINGNKLIKNELKLNNNIIINKNDKDIIKLINNINKNDNYIFDQMICIYTYQSKIKNEFYYENLYEHDETSTYELTNK